MARLQDTIADTRRLGVRCACARTVAPGQPPAPTQNAPAPRGSANPSDRYSREAEPSLVVLADPFPIWFYEHAPGEQSSRAISSETPSSRRRHSPCEIGDTQDSCIIRASARRRRQHRRLPDTSAAGGAPRIATAGRPHDPARCTATANNMLDQVGWRADALADPRAAHPCAA